MMKRILQIVLLGLAAPLVAVEVPQTSAADYIFTVPRLTNHIHGVLVDTTNSYGVIRSEDIDWIKEAIAERIYIGIGSMPSTNGLSLGVGPVVKRDDAPRRYMEYDWLDGDAPLLSGCRLGPFDRQSVYTNIYFRTDYTNGLTNAFSVITMPMTNGTTSVFTNSWRTWMDLPVTTVVTNIRYVYSVDMCHGVDGVPFPAYSNATWRAWWRLNETRIPNVRYIADARNALRGTVRLADTVSSWTGSPHMIKEEEYDSGGQTYHTVETNLIDNSYSYLSDERHAIRDRAPAFSAGVRTRFDSSLVTAGGASRVAIEAVYAGCTFYYFHTQIGTSIDDSVHTNAVVRLATPTLDVSGDKASCQVWIDAYSLCSTCASAAGVPTPPPDLSHRESANAVSSWELVVRGIIIFYRITPATKLPDW